MEKDERRLESATPEQPAPNQEAGQSQQDPTARTGESPLSGQTAPVSAPESAVVPPASETWVEGQATSDADYESGAQKAPGR
ncbi:MAG: hypothetical protein M3Z13_05945 [Candidatus Dormibacteraeota bacterium]|nr:hypothetical protein [Candidatus Dormibacteraeota bacterium]